MLLTSSALPFFKDDLLSRSQELHDQMVYFEKDRLSKIAPDQVMEIVPELNKKTSINELSDQAPDEFVEISPTVAEINEDEEEAARALAFEE